MTRKLFTPGGLVFDSAEDERRYRFDQTVASERAKHEARGYTPEHDAQHGPGHLIAFAYEYCRRGDSIKAASVLLALQDLIESQDPEDTNA